MNKKYKVLLSLLILMISPTIFAANYFKKMDECALVYSDVKPTSPVKVGVGDSFLNIRNMNNLKTKSTGELIFFYGSNSISIIANTEAQKEVIDDYMECSTFDD